MLPRLCALLLIPVLSGCNSHPPKPAPEPPAAVTYPSRPTIPPPAFKLVHQDKDTYTLATKDSATDDEIAALLWQFHDAAHAHTFDALHLSQKFIDARQPKVWFHIYRGSKCATEKFTKGPYPCGASYHATADYTLGGYKDPQYEEGILLPGDGKQVSLWDPDKH